MCLPPTQKISGPPERAHACICRVSGTGKKSRKERCSYKLKERKKKYLIKARQNAPHHEPCMHIQVHMNIYTHLEEAYSGITNVFVVKNEEAEMDK